MKLTKRLVAMILMICMVLSMLPSVSATGEETDTRAFGRRYVAPSGIEAVEDEATRVSPRTFASSYNSCDKGYITPIRNQGSYGTCWAHGAIASCEAYMIKHGIPLNGTAATTSMNLSEYHLAWYAYTKAYDKKGMLNGDSTTPDSAYLDLGGFGEIPSYTLMRWEGLASESTSALAYSKASASGLGSSYAYQYNVAHVQNCIWIPTSDMDGVKQAIMDYGAGTFGYCHEDAYENANTGAYCYIQSSFSDYSNHDVTVVGWDDNYAVSNFNSASRPSKPGAWIIKNSWGTSYGDSGYYYISYEDTASLNDTCYFYTVESVDNYDNIYQYDGTLDFNSFVNLSNGGSVANVFTADGNELLEAVSVCTKTDNTTYQIDVYKNPTTDKPKSGELVATKTGNFAYAGYYTVALDSAVALAEGDTFSVVFTNKSGSQISFGYESTGSSSGWCSWTNASLTDSCYYISSGGTTTDYSSSRSYRIKAYTSDAPAAEITVTFSVNGSSTKIAPITGTAITLPALPAIDGYTAVGWTTSAVSDTTTKPTTLYTAGSTYSGASDVTLYAVYSYTEDGGEGGGSTASGDWVKYTTAGTVPAGEYLIVYEGGNCIFDGSLTSLSSNNKKTVTITNNTISATDGDPSSFTIGADGTIKSKSGYYIGNNSNSNALNSNQTTAYTSTISVESSGDVTIKGSAGAVLRYNNSANIFRYYKSTSYTSQKAIQLYTKGSSGGSSTTTYYTTTTCQHNWKETATYAPTCTEEGWTEYECTLCGATDLGNIVDALGHTYGGATTNNDGTHTKSCSTCGTPVTEDCTFKTTTSTDATTYTCSVCGYSYGMYNLTVSGAGEGGSVNIPEGAKNGDTVSFTVTPATGYEIASVTVNSGAVALTNNGSGSYSFTMPAGSVNVAVVFSQINYNITKPDTAPVGGSVNANMTTAHYGDTVTVTATVNDGYSLESWDVKTVSGTPVEVTTARASTVSGTFTMPAESVVVSAKFAASYTVNFYVSGVLDTTASGTYASGASVEKPTDPAVPASLGSTYSFVGWVSSNFEGTLTDAPTFVTFPMTVSANADLYAVFAEGSSSGGTAVYTLVTNASALTSGANIVIAASGYNYAMSATQNGNNRGRIAITKNTADNTISFSDTAGVCEFVLGAGTKNGTWSFYDAGNSGYIYAASSSGNYLRTQSTLTDNSSWTISVTSAGVATVKAQGSNSRNLLKYNNGSSIFSCYASGQQDIALYQKTSAGGGYTNYTTGAAPCSHENTTTTTNEATCTEAGSVIVTCDDCGATVSTTVLDPIGHNYDAGAHVDATATAQGYTPYTCANCGDSYNVYDGWIVTVHDIPNSVETSSNVEDGKTFAEPSEPTAPDGFAFMGWYTSTYYNETTAPTYYDFSEAVTSHLDLYAVYALAEEGEGGDGATFTLSLTSGSDTYYVGERSGSNTYLSATTDAASAAKFGLESAGNGYYYLYYTDGTTKTYIYNNANDTSLSFSSTQPATGSYDYWDVTEANGVITLLNVNSNGSGTRSLAFNANRFSTYGSGYSNELTKTPVGGGTTYSGYTTNPVVATRYQITWMNGADQYDSYKLTEGTAITAPEKNPAKDETEAEYYTFLGWSLSENGAIVTDFGTASADTTYYAVYTTVNKVKVEWKNADGTVLATGYYKPGETPAYDGETPTKDSDDTQYYIFSAWTPEITAIAEGDSDRVYTAQFEARPRFEVSIVLSKDVVRLTKTITATATLTDMGTATTAYDASRVFTIGDSNIASVTQSGVITGNAIGATKVYVTYTVNGVDYQASASFTVQDNVAYGDYKLITENQEDWSGDYVMAGRVTGLMSDLNSLYIFGGDGNGTVATNRDNAYRLSFGTTEDMETASIIPNGSYSSDETLSIFHTGNNDAGEYAVYDEMSDVPDNFVFTFELVDDVNNYYTIRLKGTDCYLGNENTTLSGGNTMAYTLTADGTQALWKISMTTPDQVMTTEGYTPPIVLIESVYAQDAGSRAILYNCQATMFRTYGSGAYNALSPTGLGNTKNNGYSLYLYGNPNPFKAQIYYQGNQVTLDAPAEIPEGRTEAVDLTSALLPDINDYPLWEFVSGPTWSLSSDSSGLMTIDPVTGELLLNGAAGGSVALVQVSYVIHDTINDKDVTVTTQGKIEVTSSESYSTVIYESLSGNDTETQYTVYKIAGQDNTLPLSAYVVNDLTADNSKTGNVVMGGNLVWTISSTGTGVTLNGSTVDYSGANGDQIVTVTLTGATGNGVAASLATYKIYVKTVNYTADITHDDGVTGTAVVPFGTTAYTLGTQIVNANNENPGATYTVDYTNAVWSIVGDTQGALLTGNGENANLNVSGCAAGTVITVQVAGMTATTVPAAGEEAVTVTIPATTQYYTVGTETITSGAVDDVLVLDFDRAVTFNVLTNDNFDGKAITAFTLNGAPENVKINENLTAGTEKAKYALTYTPDGWIKDTVSFTYTFTLSNGAEHTATVTIIPAESVYYEDSNSAFTFEDGKRGEWTVEGTETVKEQTSSLSSSNIFGYDSNYANCGTFSAGSVHKVSVAKTNLNHTATNPSVTFRFFGTGFDVVSLTSNNTGVFKVVVDGSVRLIQTYYGYEYSETAHEVTDYVEETRYIKNADNTYTAWDGTSDPTGYNYIKRWTKEETYLYISTFYDASGNVDPNGKYVQVVYMTNWTPNATGNNSLYQIPVLKVSDLAYGEHTVKIEAIYTPGYDMQQDGSYDFYFDAVRVHNPTGGTSSYNYLSIRDGLIAGGGFGSGSGTPCGHDTVLGWNIYREATYDRKGVGTLARVCSHCGTVIERADFTVTASTADNRLDATGANGLPKTTTLSYAYTCENADAKAYLDSLTFAETWRSSNAAVMTCSASTGTPTATAMGAGTAYATLQLKYAGTVFASAIHTNDVTVEGCVHSYSSTYTDATCTASGATVYTCSLCGYSYSVADPAAPAQGHDWDDGVVTTPATCTEAGVTTYTCGRCGDTYTENTPVATGHSDTYSYTDNGDGTHDGFCTSCRDVMVDNEVHTYQDGVCTLCGAEEPAVEQYVVTYVVPDGAVAPAPQTVNAGESVMTAAAVAAPEKYTAQTYSFLGWIATTVNDTTTKQTYVAAGETYKPTSNVTLYALYTYSEGGGTGAYTLVTATSQLTEGASVVIAASGYDYAMSTKQNTNNRGLAEITKNTTDDTISFTGTDVCEFVLGEGTKTGTWSFYDASNSGYIYAASSSGNQLKTQSTLSANSSWAITVDGGVASVKAQGSSSRNVMQYNDSSSIFSCYGSASQKDIALYIKGGTAYYTTELAVGCAHENTTTTTVNATCTDAGSVTVTCDDCGKVISTTTLDAIGHNYGAPVVTTPATLTSTGVATATCANCGDTVTSDFTVAVTCDGNAVSGLLSLNADTTANLAYSVDGYTFANTASVLWASDDENVVYVESTTGEMLTGDSGSATIEMLLYDGSDCVAEISFALSIITVSYTASFVVPDGVTAIANLSGVNITLPTPSGKPTANSSATFLGWTTAAYATDNTTEPTYATAGSYTLSANTTFYALYTYSTTGGSGSSDFVLTDIASIGASDEVVITTKNANGDYYAMSNGNGTGSAPTATAVTVASDKLSATPADTIIWNISYDATVKTMKIYPKGDTAKWLYCTSTNNGVRVGTNSSNTFKINGNYLQHEGTSRYLGVFSNNDWRCYQSNGGNIQNQTLAFFVKAAGGGGTSATYYTTYPTASGGDSGEISGEQPAKYSTEYNSGTRDVVCTTLANTTASSYYTGSYTYASLSKQTGSTLLGNLRSLITSGHTSSSYDDCKNYADKTDCQNEDGKVTLFYTGVEVAWNTAQNESGASSTAFWNREHVWPQSLGGFSTSGPGADLHHIRPTDSKTNSYRGNHLYGEVSNGTAAAGSELVNNMVGGYYSGNYFEPLDNVKGDVARICLYIYTRYGSNYTDCSDITNVFQSEATLLEWNKLDPVDTWEMGRNEVVYALQGNRNPFIDYPELAWNLFNETVPTGYVTPSNGATGTASVENEIAVRSAETKADSSAIEGAAFIDGSGATNNIELMEKYGPKNEVYLANGQAIVFYLVGDNAVSNLQIGAKALNGTAKLTVTALTEAGDLVTLDKAIATATEMYYEFGTGTTSAVPWNGNTSAAIVIQNTGSGLLSLTNIRYAAADGTLNFYVNSNIVDAAKTYMETGSSVIPTDPDVDPTEPSVVPTDAPVEPTEAPVEPTDAPVEPTEAPVEPTDAPVEPTDAPVEPTEAPVEPTDAPVEPTDAPVEPTDAPVEPTDAPVEPTDAPVEPTDAPVEPTDAPVEPTDAPDEPTEEEPVGDPNAFTDLSKDAWYYDGVSYAVKKGLMKGVAADEFAPDETLTRAMLVTILYRQAGEPEVTEDVAFTDVAKDEWYSDAIAWAVSAKITMGMSATTFEPDTPVTREQMVTFLWRFAGSPESDKSLKSFPDAANVSAYAVTAMSWAVEKGIINGEDGKLNPTGNATRAQIATIFMRFEKTLA